MTTIASRLPAVNGRSALSLSRLDPAQLQLVGHTHIQESLLRIPGVNLQRGNGQEYLPAIRSPVLTGAGACGAFLIAQNGIPLRSAGFCNINELFDAHTEQAQRIEVQRGPGSAVFGSNAVHGLVNVITFDPNTRQNGRIGLEAGPNDYLRLKWADDFAADNRRFGASVTATHDGGYRHQAGYDQQKINVYHQFELGEWQLVNGLAYTNLNQETAGFISGPDAYKDKTLAQSNPNPEAFRDTRSLRFWTRFERALDTGSRLLITPYVRYTDMDFLQHFLPGDPLEENSQRSAGLQSAYYFQVTESINMMIGLDTEYTLASLVQTQAQPTAGSAFLTETIPAGSHYDYQVNAGSLAVFAGMDWSIDDRWQLDLGLRLEQVAYDYDNRILDGRTRDDGSECGFGGCRYSRPADRTDRFTDFSPKFGLSYRLGADHLVYTNYLHGFRAPQATELYRLQREQQAADLDSEQIRSLEVGFKGQWQVLAYELVAYGMTKENVIFRDSDFFNRDNAQTRHRGLELSLDFALTSAIDLGVNASYARHRYDNDQLINGGNINSNDVDTAPRHFGSARLGWNFLDSARAELEWVHMGGYYLEPENLYDYAGHNLLNLRLNWQWRNNWRVSGRLLNLTDKRYAERADFTSFTRQRYFPGEPRSLFIGLEKSWR